MGFIRLTATFADMTIWEVVSPLAGVALGWALTQASTWFGTRQADRRVVKESLYFLLELYVLLYGLERMYALLPQIATLFRQQAPKAPLAEYEAAVDEYLTQILHEALTPFIGQRLTGLKADYTTSLTKLASVDPVSAFQLRGQQDVLNELPDFATNWQDVIAKHLGEVSPDVPELIARFRQQQEPQQVADARSIVQQVAQRLASQLDRRTRRRALEVLLNPGPSGPKLLAELDKQLQKLRTIQAAMGK